MGLLGVVASVGPGRVGRAMLQGWSHQTWLVSFLFVAHDAVQRSCLGAVLAEGVDYRGVVVRVAAVI